MPATPVSDIYLRSTVTPGLKPEPADIQMGEVMFNLADMRMFVGTGGGNFVDVDLLGVGGGAAAPALNQVNVGVTPPATPQRGQVWVDTSPTPPALPDLKLYSGTTWVAASKVDGKTLGFNTNDEMEVQELDMGVF